MKMQVNSKKVLIPISPFFGEKANLQTRKVKSTLVLLLNNVDEVPIHTRYFTFLQKMSSTIGKVSKYFDNFMVILITFFNNNLRFLLKDY